MVLGVEPMIPPCQALTHSILLCHLFGPVPSHSLDTMGTSHWHREAGIGPVHCFDISRSRCSKFPKSPQALRIELRNLE